jgi:hypothetical protein
MARGWESKSVESQIESANVRARTSVVKPANPADVEALRRKESLILSRTRVLRELEAAQNPRYRNLLEKSLADLNGKLSLLEPAKARAARA